MKPKKIVSAAIAALLSITVLLTGCSTNDTLDSSSDSSSISSEVSAVSVNYKTEDYSFNWKNQDYQTIDLSQGTQTISSSGIYDVTGTLNDGSLIVDVDKDSDDGIIYLVLNNASITSSTSAPIYVKNAEKVVILLEDGTTNTIYQGSSVKTDESGDPSAAIFSTADLTITGSGTLKVTSDYNDGITSKDDLKITDGTLVIQAKQDGIIGKDLLAIENANITITAGKDGMRSTNETDTDKGNILINKGTFDITANNDGIQAYNILQIDGGTFNITTGGGYIGFTKTNNDMGFNKSSESSDSTTESQKGLKATENILINGGTFNLSCTDDTIHSNGDITIAGGTYTMQAGGKGIHADNDISITSGTITIKNAYEGIEAKNITVNSGNLSITTTDDGFNINDSTGTLSINGGEIYINADGDGLDSNGSIKMTSGTVFVDGPTNDGNGALDYDGEFTISGGTLVAAGSSGMAEATSAGTQPSILMYFSSTQSAGTQITLKDSDGNTVACYTPSKTFASIAISSPDLKSGSSYTLYSGDTKIVTFTLSDTTTYVNESGVTTKQSMGGGTGGPGGFQHDRNQPAGN